MPGAVRRGLVPRNDQATGNGGSIERKTMRHESVNLNGRRVDRQIAQRSLYVAVRRVPPNRCGAKRSSPVIMRQPKGFYRAIFMRHDLLQSG
jgi:hypothetical protein